MIGVSMRQINEKYRLSLLGNLDYQPLLDEIDRYGYVLTVME